MQYIVSKKKIGERLKSLRQDAKKSQAEVSELFGLSRSHYSQVELGKQFPSYDVLTNIAAYYGKSYEWLLHGDETLGGGAVAGEVSGVGGFKNSSEYNDIFNARFSSGPDGSKMVVYVAIAKQYSYLENREDVDYLAELPEMKLPFLESNQLYRAFEMEGNAMEGVVSRQDILVSKEVKNIGGLIPGKVYIFVNEQVIKVRRFVSYDAVHQVLICKADHEDYCEENLQVQRVREIWEVDRKITSQLKNPEEGTAKVLIDLQYALKSLREELDDLMANNQA